MRSSYYKYLICFVCFISTLACSFVNIPPLKPQKPLPTRTNTPTPTDSIPTIPKYTLSTDPCAIITTEAFSEIDDLHLLPKKIRAIFDYPIANKGEPFNATDVIDSNQSLPGVRFIVAGISPTYALIAVDRGGIAHTVEASLYYSGSQGLQLVQTWPLRPYPAIPNDLPGLKSAICK